jgi:hypothetical protein
MWKRSWVSAATKTGRRLLAGLLALLLVAACSSNGASTEVPTQVLDFATVTPSPSPTPVTSTPTAEPVLDLAELATGLPAELAGLDANQQRLAQLAMADVATSLSGPVPALQVAHVQTTRWPGPELNCGEAASIESTLRDGVPGYRIVLTTGTTVYDYRTDLDQQVVRCAATDLLDVAGETLVLIDPVAAELVALAQQRVARQLGVPAQRVRLVDIRAVNWPDTSLGCPTEDQTVIEGPVAGYRLIVSAADTDYIFHTDFDRLLPCAAGAELLPNDSD